MPASELVSIAVRLVLPPGGLILLALAGILLLRSAPRAGRLLAAAALVCLYALCTPYVAGSLLRSIEVPYADPAADGSGQAIVVLGGGTYRRAPEYGRDTVHWTTLERLRYAALLQHRLDRPLLVSSGNPGGADTTEADQMRHALLELGVEPRWMEERSRNTLENARYSAQILHAAGIERIYLVTHSWHLPRAILVFEHEGLQVIPAGTRFKSRPSGWLVDFAPHAGAMLDSWFYFHEVVGIQWYRLQLRVRR